MNRNCEKCKMSKTVYANGQWNFIGCYHEPYHGKWVCEIKECPKEIKLDRIDDNCIFEKNN